MSQEDLFITKTFGTEDRNGLSYGMSNCLLSTAFYEYKNIYHQIILSPQCPL